jgi:hypothetical protein
MWCCKPQVSAGLAQPEDRRARAQHGGLHLGAHLEKVAGQLAEEREGAQPGFDVDGASHTLPSCIADAVGTVAAPSAIRSRRVR